MGYTHYWERPKELEVEKFRQFALDAKKIIDYSIQIGIGLISDMTSNPEPIADEDQVCFNGSGRQGYETFFIPRIFDPTRWLKPSEAGLYFQFCKTNRNLYDLTVMSVLIAFKHHFDNVIVTSDGQDGNWIPAKGICDKLFGYGLDFELDKQMPLDPNNTYVITITKIDNQSQMKDADNVQDEN
jgi:hypothetical protein